MKRPSLATSVFTSVTALSDARQALIAGCCWMVDPVGVSVYAPELSDPTVTARHDALLLSLPRAASPGWMYWPSTR